ncbi:L-galactono-1,4-lactone dehydrogenase, mitochondrial [Olea europaea subsp. europaea]|uniref:L-galactono-1,4-lactone dehydrogenase, mitochondrial n=1 Tax=Olea europaea subsp. europaea TaxID=158383 RepID=A0A8S0T054_OLEEU|nr:L-galactono-1,4-lactone dehydrogenase, mitochondrial [Olea europaea subsp. europaea]
MSDASSTPLSAPLNLRSPPPPPSTASFPHSPTHRHPLPPMRSFVNNKATPFSSLTAVLLPTTHSHFSKMRSRRKPSFRYSPLPPDLHTVSNWSGNHEVQTRTFIQPETLQELESVAKDCNQNKQKTGLCGRAWMVNLALMDEVLEVDKEKKRVSVQAGIRVQQLVDGIKEYRITLQNFASIMEQQIGVIFQIRAHGAGAMLPPIDEQVISMKLVTTAKGTIEVSKEKNPALFYLARGGLGELGVVAEVTLQCVERLELVDHTFVSNLKEIKKNHKKEAVTDGIPGEDEPNINELSFTEM